MSSWLLIIFVIGLSVTLWEFASKFMKSSFHICIRFSQSAGFSFVLNFPFLLFISFNVCNALRDFPSYFIDVTLNMFLFFLVGIVLSGRSLISSRWHLLDFFYYVRMLSRFFSN